MLLIIEYEEHLVDSCALLNWKRKVTGTDPKNAGFRKFLRIAFQLKLLNISVAIEEEIERNSPTLSKLLKKWGVKPIDSAPAPAPAIADKAKALLKQLEAEGRITSKQCVGDFDLRIILVAEFYGLTVLTDEAPGKERCNIPTVCRERGVPCVSPAGLAAKYGF